MPKSKEQKRKEAFQRINASVIDPARTLMLKFQPGGSHYSRTTFEEGLEAADRDARHALSGFKRLCTAKNVDTSGNPL